MTSRAGKIALLVATLWPVLYCILFIGFIITMVLTLPRNGGSTGARPPLWFPGIFVVHVLTMLLCFALTAIYVVNVFKNDRVVESRKALWAVVILLGGFIAMPVYWYLYIWPEKKPVGAEGGPAG